MDWTWAGGLAAGLPIATVTAPVGVSGAVFLLPIQLIVFGMPNPAVTPTNLLYNVVAGPGALWRYRRDGALRGDLARRLVLGTLPGVVLGAAIRVFALPGPSVFRLLIAALLLPPGLWLCLRALAPARRRPPSAGELSPRTLTGLALAVGVVGVVGVACTEPLPRQAPTRYHRVYAITERVVHRRGARRRARGRGRRRQEPQAVSARSRCP